MDNIIINGGYRLQGKVKVQGSKNAVLPIMAASILNDGLTVISNCPRISDVDDMAELLKDIGCTINFEENNLIIDSKGIYKTEIDNALAEKIRASVVLLGPLLARFKSAKMCRFGGCNIGERPIDIHLEAFSKLNAQCTQKEDSVQVECTELVGADIALSYPSVGATENTIMAAVLAKGVTRIQNAATEPEILELCKYLTGVGAKIQGIGTSSLVIEGVTSLEDSAYRIGADRIVMGTYMCACMVTGGDIVLEQCSLSDGIGYIDVLCGMGASVSTGQDCIYIKCGRGIQALNHIKTEPYPGFPTDMQPVIMSVLCQSDGITSIKENIFERRLGLAEDLSRMGAKIQVKDNQAVIQGVNMLHGTRVSADDLRAGAALVVAGLGAKGITAIENAHYIRRGYQDICKDLRKLGADIVWVK